MIHLCIIGDVRIGDRIYVAPVVSLRADEAHPIIIGDECNIQDSVVFHGLEDSSIELGKRVSIAHGAVVHGPLKIGNDNFVGFNAVVHASILGEKCFVAHGAVVIGVKLAASYGLKCRTCGNLQFICLLFGKKVLSNTFTYFPFFLLFEAHHVVWLCQHR